MKAFARFAACLGLLAGCSPQADPPAEIRIGQLADIPSRGGVDTVDAARLAVEAVNAAGGIDVGGKTHSVKLLVRETGNTPEGTTRRSLELINREDVAAIVGSSFSRNAIPSGEVAERAGIPMICPGSTHPRTTAERRYVFRVAFVDSYQARVMARFAREDLGLSRVAVLYDVADTYSRNLSEEFQRVFEKAGGRVVAFEPFTTGDTVFDDQIARIRAAGPDAVFLPNFADTVLAQSRQLRRAGVDAVLVGSDSWLSDVQPSSEDLEGAYFSQSWHPDVARDNDEAADFVARFRNAYGRTPNELAALTFDAFGLLFDALGSVPRVDPELIRDALSRVEGYRGVTGSITYTGRGGDPLKEIVIVRVAGGEIRLVKSVDPVVLQESYDDARAPPG